MVTTQTEEKKQQYVSIKVSKETAELLRVYCFLNQKRISDVMQDVVYREFREFRQRLDEFNRLRD